MIATASIRNFDPSLLDLDDLAHKFAADLTAVPDEQRRSAILDHIDFAAGVAASSFAKLADEEGYDLATTSLYGRRFLTEWVGACRRIFPSEALSGVGWIEAEAQIRAGFNDRLDAIRNSTSASDGGVQ